MTFWGNFFSIWCSVSFLSYCYNRWTQQSSSEIQIPPFGFASEHRFVHSSLSWTTSFLHDTSPFSWIPDAFDLVPFTNLLQENCLWLHNFDFETETAIFVQSSSCDHRSCGPAQRVDRDVAAVYVASIASVEAYLRSREYEYIAAARAAMVCLPAKQFSNVGIHWQQMSTITFNQQMSRLTQSGCTVIAPWFTRLCSVVATNSTLGTMQWDEPLAKILLSQVLRVGLQWELSSCSTLGATAMDRSGDLTSDEFEDLYHSEPETLLQHEHDLLLYAPRSGDNFENLIDDVMAGVRQEVLQDTSDTLHRCP